MAKKATALLELQVLRSVAEAVGSDRDLRLVLKRVAEAIACGRTNRDVYIYIFDAEDNELLLAGATESPAATQVGSLRVAYGDGVTGWVAASRESYLVADEHARDPRFLAYPGIGEERYGAIFSVPVVSTRDELVGCITVWATSGHQFEEFEVPLVENIAALIADSLEKTRLVDSAQRHSRDTGGIHQLAAMITSRTSTVTIIDYATDLAREALGADLAVALVTDPSGVDRMFIKVGPGTDEASVDSVAGLRREMLEIDLELRRSRVSWQVAADRVARALEGTAQAVTTAAIRVGSDELGRLACYRLGNRRFPPMASDFVQTVANHSAMAIKLAIMSDELEERNSLNWFLRDVSSARSGPEELRRRAAALGLDRANAYVFVVGSVTGLPVPQLDIASTPFESGLPKLLRQVRELPSDTQFGVTPHQTVAIVPWTPGRDSLDRLRLPLLNVCTKVRSTTGAALTIGLSRPVSSVEEFGIALAEAREAMSVGSSLPNPSGVFTLDDIGHHLLLSRVSGIGSVRDRYAIAISRIAEYDRVKGTELLVTVAAFLHLRSQSAAARELIIHRNTLNQRLVRAGRLAGFDICDSDEWFPLQLALKVHQARSGSSSGTSPSRTNEAAE
jgi:sugar diacid utilization regulator/putative methionine-R-sulfoxide reductase with GAF domain